MPFDLRELEKKKRELQEKIELCESQKEAVRVAIQKLTARYNIGEIGFEEYKNEYKRIFKEKSPEQWINYFNIQIRSHRAQLDWYGSEIMKAQKSLGKKKVSTLGKEELRKDLSKKISKAEDYKQRVIGSVQDLVGKYNAREISYEQYQAEIKKLYGKNEPQKIVDYYEDYIGKAKQSLSSYSGKPKPKSNLVKLIPLVLILGLALYGLFGVVLRSEFTGLTVQTVNEVHTKTFDLVVNESAIQDLDLPYSGDLNWVKLSGAVRGEGTVKVYLDDILILDSDDLEGDGKPTITGSVITGFATEGDDSISEDSAESSDASEDSADSSSDEGSEAVSGGEGGDSSGEEQSAASNQEQPEQGASEEHPNESAEGESRDNEAGNESGTGGGNEETQINETEQEDKNETEQSTDNATGQEDVEVAGEGAVKKIMFEDYCKESCDLKGRGLNKTSYTLRIEADGAEFELDEVTYELAVEKEVTEEENVTLAGPPALIKEIPTIIIEKNWYYDLDVKEYFTGASEYYLKQTDDISTTVFESKIRMQPNENFTGVRESRIVAVNELGSYGSNLFNITVLDSENITELEQLFNATRNESLNVTTKQYKAIINRPVKWIKKIDLENVTNIENLTLEIPGESEDISIKTGEEASVAFTEAEEYESAVNEANREKIVSGGITGNVVNDLNGKKGIITRIWEWFGRFGITGSVISEEDLGDGIIEKGDKKIINVEKIFEQTNEKEIAVEYYTQAPTSAEQNINNGKRIIVSGPDGLNYTDVLAYTTIENKVPMGSNEIKFYWYADYEDAVSFGYVNATEKIKEEKIEKTKEKELPEEEQTQEETIPAEETNSSAEITGSFLTGFAVSELNKREETKKQITIEEKVKIAFDFEEFDLDNDGFVDYVEWVVPHLSNQTFDLIIEISKAEHLDENKEFVSDIYEEVKALDGNWSETIPDTHYVRVTFRRNLTSDRDITLYPRTISGTPKIEVYEEGETELIAEFTSLDDNQYNKIYLTNLQGSQDTFDLFILNGDVQFDHIIDPTTPPDISFVTPPTPENGSSQSANSIFVNISSSDSNGGHYAFTDFDHDLVLWLRMDDTNSSGDPTDISSYSNNGTKMGTTIIDSTSGYWGNGTYMDGSGDYIDLSLPSSLNLAHNFTICSWIYPKKIGAVMGIVKRGKDVITTRNQQYNLRIETTGALALWMGNTAVDVSSTSATGVIVADTWQFVCAKVNETDEMLVYKNGTDITFTGGTNTLTWPGGEVVQLIGASRTIAQSFNGTVDEVMIFNRPLSDQEILALYNTTANQYFNNFTALADGSHTFTGYAVDKLGYKNQTEERTITIGAPPDTTPPAINFTSPTPGNASSQSANSIPVNISSSDASQHYTFADFDHDLVLWMRMDDVNATGDPTDLSSYSNNGTRVNAIINSSSGYFGNGTYMDGSEDYISLKRQINNTGNITISAWYNLNEVTASYGTCIFCSSYMTFSSPGTYFGYGLWIAPTTNLLQFKQYGTTVNSVAYYATPFNTWVHAVGVMNTTDITLYLNGTKVDSRPLVEITNSRYIQTIGKDPPTNHQYFNGTIDEVLVFNRALSDQEVLALYNTAVNQYFNNFTSLAEGSHTFTGYAVDKQGYKNQTEQRTVTIDATIPVITVISPQDGEKYSATTVDFEISINKAASWCGFSLDDAANVTMTLNASNTGANYTKTGLTEALHNITFICNDTANNYGTSSINYFEVNVAAPAVDFAGPTPPDASSQNANSIFVNISSSDNGEHYVFTDFNRDVLLWMRMDDTNSSGDPTDLSPYSNNGSKQGNAAQTILGASGRSFSFDGVGDYIDTGEVLAQGQDITLSAWVKPTAIASQIIIKQDNAGLGNFEFRIADASGHLKFISGDNSWTTSSLVVSSTTLWTYVAVSFNGTQAIFYLDGGQESPSNISVIPAAPEGTNFLIGPGFNGTIDEVLVFNRTLAFGELNSLYYASAQYLHNFTDLAEGTYTFTGYAVNDFGNKNQTETRTVTVDTIIPAINFTSPTPANSSNQTENSIYVNVSSSDTNYHYTFVDFDYDLFLYYTMGDVNSSGEPTDLSFYSRNGSNVGDALQTDAGYFGKGFSVDGISAYIKAPTINNLNLTTSGFTQSMWVKLDSPPETGQTDYLSYFYAGTSDSFFFRTAESSGTYELSAYGEMNDDGFTVTKSGMTLSELTSGWHHLVSVYNLTDVVFYVDGAEIGSDGTSDVQTDLDFEMNFFGCDMVGKIDDVLLFNRSLSSQEVLALYNASTNQYSANFTNLGDGAHVFRGYTVDRAGNKNQTEERTVTKDNIVPALPFVSPIANTNPIENTISPITFTATVSDANGAGDINVSSVKANFTRSGEAVRQNLTCVDLGQDTATSKNFSCTINMWYFDEAGDWNVSIQAYDLSGASASNDTNTFTYNLLQAMAISPNNLDFGSANSADTNVYGPFTLINNTGNYDAPNVSIEGYNLVSGAYTLGVGNFTVSIASPLGGDPPDACNAPSVADWMIDEALINVTGASLPAGNHSVNDGSTGQEILYYCIPDVPELPTAVYSTPSEWVIQMALAAFVVGRGRRRKKRKKRSDLIGKLKRKLQKPGLDVHGLALLDEKLQREQGVNLSELLEEVRRAREGLQIPIDVFRQEVSPSEALCKYLRENEGFSYSEIAGVLNRDDRTVWINYHNAAKKKAKRTRVRADTIYVPVSVFRDRRLSVLEAVVIYFRERGVKNVEIARILDRDPRNIWTLYSRAVIKLKIS